MASTVVLADVIKYPTYLEVIWGDGNSTIYNDVEELSADALAVDTDQDLVKKLCLAYLLARSPQLTNIATVKNKDFIFDLSAPQPIKVQ